MFRSSTHTTAGRGPTLFTDSKDIKCKASCCFSCSFCTRALTKERDKSRAGRVLSKELLIKICEECFLCHSIVLCPTCKECKKCCLKSSCRGKTSKLLDRVVTNGCRPQGSSNLKAGLHPPLPKPTQTLKSSHSRKQLCQSSQEQLPVRSIAAAHRQKCCRTSSQPNIPRVFQSALFSTQTKQQMEPYSRPKQTESISQARKIQNGNTGNHPNIPPARGVGNLSRFQGCLLPHTHTGTIQEISQISCPRSDIPIQGSSLWSVHSALGVHCDSQGGEIDGRTQGYKNPPVPRRLVGEGEIPFNLLTTHTNPSKNVSETRLASECRKIRTGAKTSLQLRRLPIRSQVGQTDTGPVAKPSGQNKITTASTDLSGPAVHVLDRPTDSHRKTDSLRPPTHETHTVASQEQLESAGISGKDYSSPQVTSPTLAMVATGRERPTRPTLTPHKTCSADFYRRIKRRVGHSLKRAHCKGVLVSARKQAAYKLSGTESSLPSLKRVPRSLYRQDSSCSNRQYNSGSLHKQGGRHEVGPAVCIAVENLDLVFPQTSNAKSPTHPRPSKCDSGQTIQAGSTIQTEWSLLPEIFQRICSRWHRPQIDLFATRFNHKLPQFVSPVPDTLAVAVDALTLPWEDLDAYAFPPTAILGKVVEKLLDSPCRRLILIAPGWPNMPWFWDLVTMSSQVPLSLPNQPNLLTQPFNQIPHRNLTNLNLHAWLLEPQQSRNKINQISL